MMPAETLEKQEESEVVRAGCADAGTPSDACLNLEHGNASSSSEIDFDSMGLRSLTGPCLPSRSS